MPYYQVSVKSQLYKSKQSEYVPYIEKYYDLAKDSGIRVSNLAVSKILFNLATFARNTQQLADNETGFINQFLQDVGSNEDFRPNPKDIQILKDCDGITVPEKLASLNTCYKKKIKKPRSKFFRPCDAVTI